MRLNNTHLHHIHKINLIYCCLVFLSTIAGHIGRLRQTSPLLQQISQATDGTLQLATWDLHPAQVANLIYMSSAAPVSETRRTIFENYFAHNQGMCSSENICDHLRSSCLGSSGIIWDHLGSPGIIWEDSGRGSGKSLGGASEALAGLVAPEMSWKLYLHKVAPLCSCLQKLH